MFCDAPRVDVFPLGGELFFNVEGTPEKIDIIYRFFELFDWANIRVGPEILEAWQNGAVIAIAPPLRHFQEEKPALALFHHHLLPRVLGRVAQQPAA